MGAAGVYDSLNDMQRYCNKFLGREQNGDGNSNQGDSSNDKNPKMRLIRNVTQPFQYTTHNLSNYNANTNKHIMPNIPYLSSHVSFYDCNFFYLYYIKIKLLYICLVFTFDTLLNRYECEAVHISDGAVR